MPPTRLFQRGVTLSLPLALLALTVVLASCGGDDTERANTAGDQRRAGRLAELRALDSYASPALAYEAWRAARQTNDWAWVARTMTEAGVRQLAVREIAAYRQAGRGLGLAALGLDEAVAELETAAETQPNEVALAAYIATSEPLPALLATLHAMQAVRGIHAPPRLAADTLELCDMHTGGTWAIARLAYAASGRTAGWLVFQRRGDGGGAGGDGGWLIAGEPTVRPRYSAVRHPAPLPPSRVPPLPADAPLRAEYCGVRVQESLAVEPPHGADTDAVTDAAELVVREAGTPTAEVQLTATTPRPIVRATVRLIGYDIRYEPVDAVTLSLAGEGRHEVTDALLGELDGEPFYAHAVVQHVEFADGGAWHVSEGE